MRNKGYTFINITGLTIGLSACLLIGLYISFESSYDEFHKKAYRIYRLNMKTGLGASGVIPAYGAKQIAQKFPEVVNFTRYYHSDEIIIHDGRPIKEEAFYYTDASFFDIFDFSFKKGNSETALSQPNSVVVTEKTAKRYFPEGNAMAQAITLRDGTVLQVTGILESIPFNSTIQFDFLASFSTLPAPKGFDLQSQTFILLNKENNADALADKLNAIVSNKSKEGQERAYQFLGFMITGLEFGLQPITGIHLRPFWGGMIQPANNVKILYIFGCIALFVLLLACMNYMNLSTARATQRAKEISMRKVAGAHRGQLIKQFLGEAVLTTIAAGILALALAKLLLSPFNALMGLNLSFNIMFSPQSFLLFAGLLLIVGLLAGSYPALILSRFKSSPILKTSGKEPSKGSFRKGLVVFQFSVSIIIILLTLTAHNQLRYIRSKPLGYQTKAIVTLPLPNDLKQQSKVFKQEILRLSGIESASIAGGPPVKFITSATGYEGQTVEITTIAADSDYLETMGMRLIAGQGFDTPLKSDSTLSIVVNETAAQIFDLYDDVGEPLPVDLAFGSPLLTGIVNDFHTASLHKPIKPTVIYEYPHFMDSIVLRLNTSNIALTLDNLEKVWSRLAPAVPFTYHFLDETLEQLYRTEIRTAQLVTVLALLSLFIACLGLFGLAAYAAQRRTKEIGIRKVMGATVANIVGLLSKDFLKLVLIGFVIAVPVAWYFMNQWLQDFAYRIDIGIGIFLLAGGLTLLIALATVSWQSVRAALANPVDSLRSE